jgi:hypothetical protein
MPQTPAGTIDVDRISVYHPLRWRRRRDRNQSEHDANDSPGLTIPLLNRRLMVLASA